MYIQVRNRKIWNATKNAVSFSLHTHWEFHDKQICVLRKRDCKFLTKIHNVLIEPVCRVLACFNQILNVTLFRNILKFHVSLTTNWECHLIFCIKNSCSLKVTNRKSKIQNKTNSIPRSMDSRPFIGLFHALLPVN